MSRHSNGDGNIRERSPGRWEASVMLAGHRYYASASSELAVRRRLRELSVKHAQGQLVPHSRLTVERHLDDWVESGRADWKPRTTEYYETVCRLYLKPAFGHRRLQALGSHELARQFSQWKASGDLAGGTLLNVHKTLHRALTVAVRWGRLSINPANGVEPPRARRAVPTLWTPEELHRFLTETRDSHWEVAWALLLGTGCRLGEALALEWADIEHDSATVKIERSLSVSLSGVGLTAPKSRAGTRTLSLPDWTLLVLTSWKRQQLKERLASGSGWQAGNRVLTRPNGSAATADTIRWAFRLACRASDVPLVRLHDMRHLHASLLLASGHPLPAVAARLGHASTAVTASVYAHALAGQDTEAARTIDRLVPQLPRLTDIYVELG